MLNLLLIVGYAFESCQSIQVNPMSLKAQADSTAIRIVRNRTYNSSEIIRISKYFYTQCLDTFLVKYFNNGFQSMEGKISRYLSDSVMRRQGINNYYLDSYTIVFTSKVSPTATLLLSFTMSDDYYELDYYRFVEPDGRVGVRRKCWLDYKDDDDIIPFK